MEKLIFKIENLDHYGKGIARINGMPVFIENALPGEEVEIEITKTKKNLMEGTVLDRIKTSEKRIEPACPYFGICGGCDLMHMSYSDQLSFKENKVKEIMLKFVNFDNVKEIMPSYQFNYRNKVTLQVKEKMGYYKKKSYEIIPVDNCLLASNSINEIIMRLNSISLINVEQIVIRTTKKEKMLVLYIKNSIDEKYMVDNFKDLDSIITILNNKEKVIHGKSYIEEEINNLKFVISPTSFFQVNTEGMIRLYNKALEYAQISSDDSILDLYCGTGTIGIYCSKGAKNVLGIEINEHAIKDAFVNKELNNIDNIDFKVGDVKDVLNKTKFKPSIIFVDPPRSGLDGKTVEHLLNLKPEKIVYISCDPVTLARDLNLLKAEYDIIEVTPVDMFPNTFHVECIVKLRKKRGKGND